MVIGLADYFEFSINGWFYGRYRLTIERVGNEYMGKFESFPNTGTVKEFPITKKQNEKLQKILNEIGVEEWFCHYEPFSAYVCDGIQWEMRIDDLLYEGDNVFPDGFDFLARSLEHQFDGADFYAEDSFEEGNIYSESKTGFEHIAHYAHWIPESIDEKDCISCWRFDFDDPEATAYLEDVQKQIKHDLDLLTKRHGWLINYTEALASRGIGLKARAIETVDPDELDAETIIAMLVYVMHFDRASNSDYFYTYLTNGVFARLLERLRVLLLEAECVE